MKLVEKRSTAGQIERNDGQRFGDQEGREKNKGTETTLKKNRGREEERSVRTKQWVFNLMNDEATFTKIEHSGTGEKIRTFAGKRFPSMHSDCLDEIVPAKQRDLVEGE